MSLKKILLYVLIIVIVFLKFFTDGEHIPPILPSILSATGDAIVFFAFAVYTFSYLVVTHKRFNGGGIGIYVLLFGLVWLVSICLNINYIHWQSSLLFLFGHFEPILLALMIVNLDYDVAFHRRIVTFIFIIGIAQIFIGLLQIPFALFLGWGTEFISGTLGRGNAQYAFFMAMVCFFILGIYLYDKRRKYLLLLLSLAILVYYGPDYAVTWISLPVTMIFLTMLYPRLRTSQKIFYFLVLVFSSIIALIVYRSLLWSSSSMSHASDYFSQYIKQPRIILQLGKIKAITNLPLLYQEKAHYALVGVGPGAYSSRAFIAFFPTGFFMGDEPFVISKYFYIQYNSPLVDKYIMPYSYVGKIGGYMFGSGKLDSPFQSYATIAAETGILGFIFFFAIYYKVFKLSLEINKRARRENDEFHWVVSFVSIGNILYLSQLALFDNWFEIARVSILTWILLAILFYKKASLKQSALRRSYGSRNREQLLVR